MRRSRSLLPRALGVLLALAHGALGCNAVLGIHEVDAYSDDSGVGPIPDDGTGGEDGTTIPLPGEDSAVDSAADTQTPDADAAPDVVTLPEPNAACVLGAKARSELTFSATQSPQSGGATVTVSVTDTAMGLTNIAIRACTPTSATPVVNTEATVISNNAPFMWRFDAQFLPRGKTQIAVVADPGGTVYETGEITVP